LTAGADYWYQVKRPRLAEKGTGATSTTTTTTTTSTITTTTTFTTMTTTKTSNVLDFHKSCKKCGEPLKITYDQDGNELTTCSNFPRCLQNFFSHHSDSDSD